MKRLIIPVVAGLVAVALVGLLAYGLASRSTKDTLAQAVADGRFPPAPSRTLPVLGSEETSSVAALRGQVVLVNFWASWCGPCEAEADVLNRAHRQLVAADAGTVLGVTVDDTPPALARFVDQHNVGFPSIRDIGSKLGKSYGTLGVPETFLVDRRGRIVALRRGPIDDAWVKSALGGVL
jgi:cytochrome c biogenesis protein CcmG/thiol:disulfide interchange protein DsbE